jgi:hypothetical protein
MRLSTAAHVSARFPYVSPAGTLIRDGRVAGHVVDGAYFKNSGSASAGEILNASRGLLDSAGYRLARAKDTVDVVPIVLVMRFQEHASRNCVEPSCGMVPRPQLVMKESTLPLQTLMNTSTARGDFSLDAIRIQMSRVARLQRRKPRRPRSWRRPCGKPRLRCRWAGRFPRWLRRRWPINWKAGCRIPKRCATWTAFSRIRSPPSRWHGLPGRLAIFPAGSVRSSPSLCSPSKKSASAWTPRC